MMFKLKNSMQLNFEFHFIGNIPENKKIAKSNIYILMFYKDFKY